MTEPADHPDNVLRIERRFRAARPFVFALWSKPELLSPWWGPEGCRLKTCEIDFRPGGAWAYNMVSAEASHWTRGTYHEIRAPERLVFSYDFEAFEIHSVVSVIFEEDGDGTLMRFRQTGFPSEEHCEGHRWGWNSTFGLLENALLQLHGLGSVWPELPKGKESEVARDLEAARQRHDAGREVSPVPVP